MLETRSTVSTVLDEGFRAVLDKWLFLQLALVTENVGAIESQQETARRVIEFLAQFSAADVIKLATPFFWMNLIRLHGAAARPGPAMEDALSGLAISAADSFLGHSMQGTEFVLKLRPRDKGYCFPNLGFQISGQSTIRLRHAGKGQVVTNPHLPPAINDRRPTLNVPGFPLVRLLLSDDPLVLSDGYKAKLDPNTRNADGLASRIQSALYIIGELAPTLGARIENLVRWYVPLHSRDFRIHNSFSASTLFGVIFLSDAYSGLRLAEAIVHEFHHNELYMLMAVEDVFEDDQSHLYYSPWREDARPLMGLFHALHVFANVKRFLEEARQSRRFASASDELESDCDLLTWRLRIALQQVPWEKVGPTGHRILDDVRKVAAVTPHKLNSVPQQLLTHLQLWKERHPKLGAVECAG